MKRYVITHQDEGIFLGIAILAFFSLKESAGQTQAPVFENMEQAGQFLVDTGLDAAFHGDMSKFAYIEVETATDMYATLDEMEAAGLAHLFGDMRQNEADLAFAEMPAMGMC